MYLRWATDTPAQGVALSEALPFGRIEAGEEVHWELLGREELHLGRLKPPSR